MNRTAVGPGPHGQEGAKWGCALICLVEWKRCPPQLCPAFYNSRTWAPVPEDWWLFRRSQAHSGRDRHRTLMWKGQRPIIVWLSCMMLFSGSFLPTLWCLSGRPLGRCAYPAILPRGGKWGGGHWWGAENDGALSLHMKKLGGGQNGNRANRCHLSLCKSQEFYLPLG